MTCWDAEELVAREADGTLSEAEVASLDAHVAGCDACARLRAANLAAKPVLASRIDSPAPADLLARVMAAVDEPAGEAWLGAIDWRRWTEWLLPVAAGLVLAATLLGGGPSRTGPADPPAEQASEAAADSWLADEGQAAASASPLSQSVSTDEVMATMLGQAAAVTGAVDER